MLLDPQRLMSEAAPAAGRRPPSSTHLMLQHPSPPCVSNKALWVPVQARKGKVKCSRRVVLPIWGPTVRFCREMRGGRHVPV